MRIIWQALIHLRSEGIDIEDWGQRCDDSLGTWGSLKAKAPKLKAILRPVQDREGRRIKGELQVST